MRNKRLIIFFSILCALTLFIVLSSVLFSVQHVYENCINGDSSIVLQDGQTLKESVLSNHNFKKGKSIFFADKEKAKKSLEENIPIIKVEDIVKKFPNRIYIEYKIVFEYFEIHSGANFYILGDECKITNVVKQSYDNDKIVRIFLDGDIGTPKAGQIMTSTKSGEIEILSEILTSFQRLNLQYYEITQMFDFIDIKSDHEYIFMKTSTGVYFRIIGWDNMLLKLQQALSVYKSSINYRSQGTISVSDSLYATHTNEVFYEGN